MAAPPRRAEPPRIPQAPPVPSPAERHAEEDRLRALRQAEGRERRSVVRGLVMLALIVLVLSMARAGMERVFTHGWWRP